MTRLGIVVGVLMAIMAGCDDEQGQPAASPTSTTSAPASTSSSTTTVASTTTTTSPPEDHPYGQRYIGLIFTASGDAVVVDGKPLPGLTILAEAAVYDPGHNRDQPYPHGLTYVRDPNHEMVWFGQTAGDRSPTGGAPPNKLIDVLVVPTHLSDERIWFGDCEGHSSVPATEIVALVRVTDTPSWAAIKAWRANRQAEEFEPMPTEGIECENVGYGA